jgi:hypothetical protein
MRSIYFLMACFLLTGCQSFTEEGLTDIASMAKCPANGCANQSPSANDMSLSYLGPRPMFSPLSDTTVAVGGDCHASTYPNNQISITVYRDLTALFQSPHAHIVGLDGATVSCVKGRFNFVINGALLNTSASYKIRLQMTGLDAQNQAYTSPGSVLEIPFIRN